MAEEAERKPWTELLRGLEQTSKRRRDSVKRIGRKAHVLGQMARAGMPVPPAWVLDARHFEAFAERSLPRKHSIRQLIKLAGTRAGDERCARAYEEMMAAPVDDAVVEAVEALWTEQLRQLPLGVAVRPSIAASGALAGAAAEHLHSLVGLEEPTAIIAALRSVWASAVLSVAVGAYARARLKDVGVAVILQRVVPTDSVGLLTRTTDVSAPAGSEEWHIGVLLGEQASDRGPGDGQRWRRRAQLLLPLSLGKGGKEPPAPLACMRDKLEPRGFEQLIELGQEGERLLGSSAVFHFALEQTQGEECEMHILNVDESPRWQPLSGGDESTTWVEITMGGRGLEPPTRLTQSIVDRMVDGAVTSLLSSLHSKLDSDSQLVTNWSGRSYLNMTALVAAFRDVPLLAPEDLLHAVGGVGVERMVVLAGRAAAVGRSRWRMPLIGSSALVDQITLDSDVAQLERAIERDARGLADMDLTILPGDAMATTLTSAQALLERSGELWMKCAAAQLALQLTMHALVRRRLPDTEPKLGYSLTSGGGGSFLTAMSSDLIRLVDVFRGDDRALARLEQGGVRGHRDLPDGPARGALGQFLAGHGDLAFGVFELSTPRWREDASELLEMIELLRSCGELESIDALHQHARAAADTELARWEPELNLVQRRLLRGLLDRSAAVMRKRAAVDRLVLRALSTLRRVVLDVDRRLRRIDSGTVELAAFHCSAERLAGAFKSGRPELSRTGLMRTIERRQQSATPAPPASFVGSPPRGGIPIVARDTLVGSGVSAGVVEGRARILGGILPERIEPGDILVVNTFDPALTPLCAIARGVVAETGGALSMAASGLRSLSIPAVFGAPNAPLQLSDGEPLRVDGTRGTVQRLAVSQQLRDGSEPPASGSD